MTSMYGVGCFCFKQKTAYEMRISDWSSDVCSSELAAGLGRDLPRKLLGGEDLFEDAFELYFAPATACLDVAEHALEIADTIGERLHFAEPLVHLFEAIAEIGRAHV